jgi:L-alanine-DL-glutamate epimerase-like enolase superfamily enzyme
MMGGMLESRVALTAFAHFALAHDNVIFHDMDTCLLGHTEDPVIGGAQYKGYYLQTPNEPGIGADVDEKFLKKCVQTVI